jgi:hypothetical protein
MAKKQRQQCVGQTLGEYAILFAIVLGAAIAMQQVVKTKLQGAVNKYTNEYAVAAGNGTAVASFEPNRTVNSVSGVSSNFSNVRVGIVDIKSNSQTNITKGL